MSRTQRAKENGAESEREGGNKREWREEGN